MLIEDRPAVKLLQAMLGRLGSLPLCRRIHDCRLASTVQRPLGGIIVIEPVGVFIDVVVLRSIWWVVINYLLLSTALYSTTRELDDLHRLCCGTKRLLTIYTYH